MLGIRIEGEYHWGYWVRVPGTSKHQSALPLPPPTTLIGALVFPLAREGLLKDPKNNNKISGETVLAAAEDEIAPRSISSVFENTIVGASISIDGKAIIWEDINKYTTVHFQTTTKDKPEEKEAGGRRYLDKYKSGAITSGKVLYPKGRATVFYAIDRDLVSKAIQPPWEKHLEEACWAITRVGSKESIFSVKRVKVVELSRKTDCQVKTRLYFPAAAGEVRVSEKYYRLAFWRGGWGKGETPSFYDYVIPGSRSPIASEVISVQVRGAAYEFAPQEVMLIER
ncbi:MAG: type I-A CRISPR-associated protein Cas5a [Candidatus Methanosuratincola petrocarbonis]